MNIVLIQKSFYCIILLKLKQQIIYYEWKCAKNTLKSVHLQAKLQRKCFDFHLHLHRKISYII